MATLRLKAIVCFETEDNWGADDAYIRVNEVTVWGPTKINDNQGMAINVDVAFTTSASISLWDKDDADPDDNLGTHVAWAAEAGKGEITASYNADDCNYRIVYEVI